MSKYEKEKPEKKGISVFMISISIAIIVFFAIISSLFSRIFPNEILFFGVIPMSFQSFMFGLFTFLITTFTVIYVLRRSK